MDSIVLRLFSSFVVVVVIDVVFIVVVVINIDVYAASNVDQRLLVMEVELGWWVGGGVQTYFYVKPNSVE